MAAFRHPIPRIFFLIILFIPISELRAQLTVSVEDHTGYERKSWPVSGGIPFPKGEIFDANQVSLNGSTNETLDQSSTMLLFFIDASILYLIL